MSEPTTLEEVDAAIETARYNLNGVCIQGSAAETAAALERLNELKTRRLTILHAYT